MSTAIYARKSTESEDRQVQSLEDQLRVLHQKATASGVTVSKVFTESKSAKAPGERPEFERLMSEVESGQIDSVLTWSINRLTRNPIDGGRIAYALQMGKLKAIHTPDRTYTPEDSALLLAVETGIATSYIQDLRKNVKRGMEGNALRGWFPHKAPIGYKNNAETREIDPHPEDFAKVRRLWDLALTGNFTLKELDTEARALKLTNSRKSKAPIGRTTIYKLFRNPFYLGRFQHNGEWFTGKHRPLVSPAEFELVQKLFKRPTTVRCSREKNPYSGAIKCAVCGYSVVLTQKTKRRNNGSTKTYTYLQCGGAGCGRQGIRFEEFENQVLGTLRSVSLPPSGIDWLKRAVLESFDQELPGQSVSASMAEETLAEHLRRMERLTLMRLDGEITSTEFATLKGSLSAEIESAKGLVQSASRTVEQALAIASRLCGTLETVARTTFDKTSLSRSTLLDAFETVQLENGKPKLALIGVLQKIAAFGLLETSSQCPKPGDLVPANSLWWVLVDQIRNWSMEQAKAEVDQNMRPTGS